MDEGIKNWANEILENLENQNFKISGASGSKCDFFAIWAGGKANKSAEEIVQWEIYLSDSGIVINWKHLVSKESVSIEFFEKMNRINAGTTVSKVELIPENKEDYAVNFSFFYPAYADPEEGFSKCLDTWCDDHEKVETGENSLW